ncbi:MAG: ATP-dependent Clp protease ATP-binding subunit ClpB, partial [Paracoccaceae bacterium]
MNLEKFTERSRGFLQAAQIIATRELHQKLSPEHLLKALLDDDQGLASNLILHAGGELAQVKDSLVLALGKLPKVTGDAAPFMDPALVKVLDEAEAIAKKAGDQFVPVERVLMALTLVKTNAKNSLDAGGVTAQKLNGSINSIRKG